MKWLKKEDTKMIMEKIDRYGRQVMETNTCK